MSKKDDCMEEKPGWYNGQFLDEVGFCCDFICRHPMACVGGKFFFKEGRIYDENSIKKQIYEMLRPYLKVGWMFSCSDMKSKRNFGEWTFCPLSTSVTLRLKTGIKNQALWKG